jgi:hypothetical protein
MVPSIVEVVVWAVALKDKGWNMTRVKESITSEQEYLFSLP